MSITIVTPFQAMRIQSSKKTFIIFDTTKGKLTKYILTDDLRRYRDKHSNFRLLGVFKKEVTVKL